MASGPCAAVKDADAVILATEWKEFRDLDWKRISKEVSRPLLIDARNFLNPATMKDLGYEYYSFGRPE